MNAAHIVPESVKVNSGFQVRKFFAESFRQSRESAEMDSDVQIRTFDKAGRDVRQVGVAANWGWDCLDNFRWAVPVRPRVIGFAVDLNQLREIRIGSKALLHCSNVRLEGIAGDLQSTCDPMTHVSHKFQRAGTIALSNEIRDHQFRLSVQGNPCIAVSSFGGIVLVQPLLFGVNKTPKLLQFHR
jgi:hypothetical protein